MNDELRAMTKNQRSFARAMMRSSLMPSEKYSCSVSPLRFVTVVQRTPRSIDATRERRFRHDPAVPDGIDQVIPSNHPIAIAHEIMNQIEHLRLDRDERSA